METTLLPPHYIGPASGFVRTGQRAVQLGATDDQRHASYSSIRQKIVLAPDALTASLSFWYRAESKDRCCHDRLGVLLLDSQKRVVKTLWKLELPHALDAQWQHVNLDLTPNLASHAGQTLWLYFFTYNDGDGNATVLYLDDIQASLCFPTTPPTPAPTATPIPPPTDTPTVAPTTTTAPPTATPATTPAVTPTWTTTPTVLPAATNNVNIAQRPSPASPATSPRVANKEPTAAWSAVRHIVTSHQFRIAVILLFLSVVTIFSWGLFFHHRDGTM